MAVSSSTQMNSGSASTGGANSRNEATAAAPHARSQGGAPPPHARGSSTLASGARPSVTSVHRSSASLPSERSRDRHTRSPPRTPGVRTGGHNVSSRSPSDMISVNPAGAPHHRHEGSGVRGSASPGVRGSAPPRPPSTGSDYGAGNDGQQLIDPQSILVDMRGGGVDQGHDNIVAQQMMTQQIVTSNMNPGVVAGGGRGGATPHPRTTAPSPAPLPRTEGHSEALPDILNSHILPPYSGRPNQHRHSRHSNERHHHHDRPHRDLRHSRASAGANRGQGNRDGNNGHTSRHHVRPARRRPPPQTVLDDEDKGCCNSDCCVDCLTVLTTFKWVLVSLALLGVCCVVTGIILGALHITEGSSFLTLSLMFIGLGVMLVVVVGVGWKCTPHGHEPCHLLFNLGDHSVRDVGRIRVPRQHRDRNHWYGGTLYSEFRYRRPPPSYNASMQDYQQQLMAAQIHQNPGDNPAPDNPDNLSLPSSPPPTYRSRASMTRPALHITFPNPQGGDYPSSQPPTYRSRAGTLNEPHSPRPAIQIEGDFTQSSDGTATSTDAAQLRTAETPGGETTNNSTQSQPPDGVSGDMTVVHARSASSGGMSVGSRSVEGGTDSRSSTLTQRGIRMVEHLEVMLDNTLRDMDNGGVAANPDANSTESVGQPANGNTDDTIADVRL